jgi:pimeloyl-ACP methyl ester carboxylesterase
MQRYRKQPLRVSTCGVRMSRAERALRQHVELVAAALDAPKGKSLVWFEDSAHMPYYEEPVFFRNALLRALGENPAPSPALSPA